MKKTYNLFPLNEKNILMLEFIVMSISVIGIAFQSLFNQGWNSEYFIDTLYKVLGVIVFMSILYFIPKIKASTKAILLSIIIITIGFQSLYQAPYIKVHMVHLFVGVILIIPFFNRYQLLLLMLLSNLGFFILYEMNLEYIVGSTGLINPMGPTTMFFISLNTFFILLYIVIERERFKEKEANLKMKESLISMGKYNAIFNNTENVIIVLDEVGIVKRVNPATKTILNISELDLIGRDLNYLFKENIEIEKFKKLFNIVVEKSISQKEHFELKVEDVKKSMEVILVPIISEKKIIRVLFMGNDVTILKEKEEEIKKLRYSDVLTTLPNQFMFMDLVSELIKSDFSNNLKFSIIYIDISEFKRINEEHGRQIGDAVLIEAGLRLKSIALKKERLARVGGDKFAILVWQASKSEGLIERKKIFEESLYGSFLSHDDIKIRVKIGMASYPEDGKTYKELMEKAESFKN